MLLFSQLSSAEIIKSMIFERIENEKMKKKSRHGSLPLFLFYNVRKETTFGNLDGERKEERIQMIKIFAERKRLTSPPPPPPGTYQRCEGERGRSKGEQ